MSTSQLCNWDATISCNGGITREKVLGFLKEHCKHFAFQQERAESGYLHFQCRFSLGTKRRLSELNTLLVGMGLGCHLSPTMNENQLPNRAFYVMKPESRVDGPWTSEDKEPKYVPRQVRDITLYPWQQTILDDANCWDTRHVNVVINPNGNIGKSTLCTYARVHEIGRNIPPVNNYKDVMRMVMSCPVSRLYFIDMPRAIDQKTMAGLIAGIEEVKSGHAWDDRYKWEEKDFDCPNIWVFTNHLPDTRFLSGDRWKLWMINESKQLVPHHNIPPAGGSGGEGGVGMLPAALIAGAAPHPPASGGIQIIDNDDDDFE